MNPKLIKLTDKIYMYTGSLWPGQATGYNKINDNDNNNMNQIKKQNKFCE